MTRINTHVPILDEHLRAARTEYCRIPNSVLKYIDEDRIGALVKKIVDEQPKQYTVRTNDNPAGGKGHMLFFFNKLLFVRAQYVLVNGECAKRGFKSDSWWPSDRNSDLRHFMHLWIPTKEDIILCMRRQIERIPAKPHIYGHRVTYDEAKQAILTDRIPERVVELIHGQTG